MAEDVYEKLADALDKIPAGFPRTPSNVEILMLKKIFSLEEASLASQLGREMEPLELIAERVGLPVDEAKARLMEMAERRIVRSDEAEGKLRFRLLSFIIIFEANLDHELAHLHEKYWRDGGKTQMMMIQPPFYRVVPSRHAVKSEWILPYDDVKAIILANKSFQLRECVCRKQQDFVDRKCDFPLDMCLFFSPGESDPTPYDISQEEALAVLDKADEIGLVHSVANFQEVGYFCNCCGCCCDNLRAINEWSIKDSIAYANYFSVINADECLGCGTCVDRCQVHAISLQDGAAVIDIERCIGCGLCVTGCPNGVAKLQQKPDEEIVNPPFDFENWELERLRNRGLDK